MQIAGVRCTCDHVNFGVSGRGSEVDVEYRERKRKKKERVKFVPKAINCLLGCMSDSYFVFYSNSF